MKKLSPEKGYLLVSSLGAWMTHLMGPYLTLWLKSIGFSFAQIGELQSVSSFTTFMTDFPTGGLADKYGRRSNFAVGAFLFGTALIIVSFSNFFLLTLIAFVLAGLGDAFMSGTLVPWLYDALKGDNEKVYTVFSRMKILNGLLGTIAGIFGGLIVHYALNLPLTLAGFFGICASLTAILFLEENYGHGKTKAYKDIILHGIKHIAREKSLQYLLLSGFFLSFANRSFFMFWMILAKNLGLSDSGVGYTYPILILSTSLGGFMALKLSKFFDHRKLLLITTSLIGLLIVMMGLVKNLVSLLILIILLEIVMAMRSPAMRTFKNELIPSPIRSTVSSALNTIGSFFIMLANVGVGIMADRYNLGETYIISGILALFASVFLLVAIRYNTSNS